MERFPRSRSKGEPNANPITYALPSQLRTRDESGDEHKAVRIRPAKADNAMTPAQNPEIRDHFPCPGGYIKFSVIRRNAGNEPKYIRTLSFTIIASCLIASTSTSTAPRRNCSPCES